MAEWEPDQTIDPNSPPTMPVGGEAMTPDSTHLDATNGESPLSTSLDPFATRAGSSMFVGSTAPGWAGEPPTFGEFAVRARRFHRMRLLARGGLGAVFIAHDNELNRDVALKEILERQADDLTSRARFLLEAEITGSLEHPGIVPVYGLGQYSDGRPYYAMRLIQGKTLGEAIRAHHQTESPTRDPGERLLSLRKLLGRFVEVCNALAYAHSKGVIHRDIKPSNVMLGKFGETLLVDWGLAKRLGHDDPAREEADEPIDPGYSNRGEFQTIQGASFGTPHFMSPEQARGDIEHLGQASDIYSLGATLYVLLAGRLPFEGQEYDRIIEKTIEGEFLRPRQSNKLVPPGLEAVCLKAMAREPESRYPTARSMAEDLERWMADEPVSAWREPRTVRAQRWIKVHRTLMTSAAAAVLVATLGIAYAVYAEKLRQAEHQARALGWVRTLVRADIAELPQLLDQSSEERQWILPVLARRAGWSEMDPKVRLHLALALIQFDPSKREAEREPLLEALLQADPAQLPVIRNALSGQREQLIPRLWAILEDPLSDPLGRFNAACALATYDPPWTEKSRTRWVPHGPFLVEWTLDEIQQSASRYTVLKQTLEPIDEILFAPLLVIFSDRATKHPTRRSIGVNLLNDFAEGSFEEVELLLNADPSEYSYYLIRLHDGVNDDLLGVIERLDREIRKIPDPSWDELPTDPASRPAAALARSRNRQALAERQGRAGVALVQLGAADRAWPLLRQTADPSLRTEMVQGFAVYHADPAALIARLAIEPDLSARRALILALGDYPISGIGLPIRKALVNRLARSFQSETDPGLHSAIDWLLRVRWGETSRIAEIEDRLAGSDPLDDRDWYVNQQKQTLAILRGPISAMIGSPELEFARSPLEEPHRVRIDRTFAIGTREVTVREYARFLADNTDLKPFNPIDHLRQDGPMLSVNFFDAVRYCNWLSDQEKIPESECCYPREVRRGMTLTGDIHRRTGYRLPTQVEWEIACRAGASTARFFGDSESMTRHYAWTRLDSGSLPQPVGRLKPNDRGLFDALGNAWEWTIDTGTRYRIDPDAPSIEETVETEVSDDVARVLRGGSFDYGPEMSRSANRPGLTPSSRYYTLGFRGGQDSPLVGGQVSRSPLKIGGMPADPPVRSMDEPVAFVVEEE